jgi:uncharacterized protein YjiS (DUF1127 family)
MYQYNRVPEMTSAYDLTQALYRMPLPPLSRLVLTFAVTLVIWDLRRRTRKDLGRLPDHLLQDVGLDPFTAHLEADKPFWRG